METPPRAATQNLTHPQLDSTPLSELRDQIFAWRNTRTRRTRMPEELWSRAVALASEHGVWRVAKFVRVRFDTLKTRAESATETRPGAPCHDARPGRSGFVEMAMPPAAAALTPLVDSRTSRTLGAPIAAKHSTIIELSAANGARLVIGLDKADALDVENVAAALWRLAR